MMAIVMTSDFYQNSKKYIKNKLKTLLEQNNLNRYSKNKESYKYVINYNNQTKRNIIVYEVSKLREDNIIKKIRYMNADEYLFYAALFKVMLLDLKINLVMYIN